MISFGTIIYNEKKHIRTMLNNIVGYTDDIVVVDQGSTDKTLETIKEWDVNHIVKIIHKSNKGYADPDRTLTLSQGKYDWMFLIDADERIPTGIPFDDLVAMGYGAINFPMRSLYFELDSGYEGFSYEECLAKGKEVQEGYPDYHPRLLKKGTVWPSAVHDRFRAEREYNAFEYDMLHLKTFEGQMEKNRRYARMFPEWADRLSRHSMYIQQSLNKPVTGLER